MLGILEALQVVDLRGLREVGADAVGTNAVSSVAGRKAGGEMGDGSLFSVYYQKVPGDYRCSLLWSRWQLPE
mgnify:CR=1 FL=1